MQQGSRESRGEGLGRCAESRGGLVGQTQLSCPHRQVQLCYHFLSSPPLAQVLLKRLLKGTVGGWLMEGAAERGCWSSVCCGAGVVRGVFGLKDCRGLRGLTTAELAMLLTHAGCKREAAGLEVAQRRMGTPVELLLFWLAVVCGCRGLLLLRLAAKFACRAVSPAADPWPAASNPALSVTSVFVALHHHDLPRWPLLSLA